MKRIVLILFALGLVALGLRAGWRAAFRAGWTAGQQQAENPERIARRFNEIYWERQLPGYRTAWLGALAQQTPTDLWSIQQILCDVRPDFVIETGTFKGGSALFHAMVLQQINPQARLLTVDIAPDVITASHYAAFREMVQVLTGGSTSPEILKQVSDKVRGRRTLVLLDSSHAREHVANELRLYAPLVSVGSYMIVHDTNLYGEGPPVVEGPLAAVREFVAANPQFQIDRSREMMMLTLSSSGYLKKVRE